MLNWKNFSFDCKYYSKMNNLPQRPQITLLRSVERLELNSQKCSKNIMIERLYIACRIDISYYYTHIIGVKMIRNWNIARNQLWGTRARYAKCYYSACSLIQLYTVPLVFNIYKHSIRIYESMLLVWLILLLWSYGYSQWVFACFFPHCVLALITRDVSIFFVLYLSPKTYKHVRSTRLLLIKILTYS